MPRNKMDMETMELYKRIPTSVYKDANYLCSNCNCEYEEVRNIAPRKVKMANYEKHCPSCHCPSERQRLSASDKSRTLKNVEAMLNRYERVFTEPIIPAIKKSQSSPLSQKICWHNYQMNSRPRCPKRLPQMRRQCRNEHDGYLSGVFRLKGDAVNSEIVNEDSELCLKYMQSVPIKSSLKKHNCCREPEGSPGDQEYSDTDSVISMNCIQEIRQLKKSYASNLESRRHCIGKSSEYIKEMKIKSDVDHQQNEHECQEMGGPSLTFENMEKQKCHKAPMFCEDNERNKKLHFDVGKAIKPKMPGDDSYSVLAKEPFDKSAPDGSTHLAKVDLYSTKNHILESIDHMLGTMDDVKKPAPQQEQTDQEIIDKMAQEFQENGWQLLLNALTIHRNSTNSDKRTVRLECLNHIRQELVKLYALESTLNNYSPKQQSLSSYDMPGNEAQQQSHQLLEQKIADP